MIFCSEVSIRTVQQSFDSFNLQRKTRSEIRLDILSGSFSTTPGMTIAGGLAITQTGMTVGAVTVMSSGVVTTTNAMTVSGNNAGDHNAGDDNHDVAAHSNHAMQVPEILNSNNDVRNTKNNIVKLPY